MNYVSGKNTAIETLTFSVVSGFGDMFVSHTNNKSISVFDAYHDAPGFTERCPVMGRAKQYYLDKFYRPCFCSDQFVARNCTLAVCVRGSFGCAGRTCFGL